MSTQYVYKFHNLHVSEILMIIVYNMYLGLFYGFTIDFCMESTLCVQRVYTINMVLPYFSKLLPAILLKKWL